MMTQDPPLPSVEHEEFGKLTLYRNYNEVKPLLNKKFKVVSQDNNKEIIWIKIEDTQKVIPLSFSAMIYLLRN